ncbi:predicted protein [Postia placenta Mad-698-R]|nr:predicted protein [Postia placenta Mad-698-R]
MHHKRWDTLVYIDGDPAEEHHFRFENENTVSCYIASEAGKRFSVQWRSDLSMTASVNCFMDGVCMGGSKTDPGRNGSRWYVKTDDNIRYPFMFAPLVLTDDDGIADPDDVSAESIGIIEVAVHRVRFSGYPWRHTPKPRPMPADRAPVHERSKKAGAHCVSLGDGFKGADPPDAGQPSPRVIYIDPPADPYIRFIFYYKPREVLQADGIMPLNPPPRPTAYLVPKREPSATPALYTNDSDDEGREVESLLRYREHTTAPSVKSGPSHRRVIDLDAKVIDLTILDD